MSPEPALPDAEVVALGALYWTHLGRAPDPEVEKFYLDLRRSGWSLEELGDHMSSTPGALERRERVVQAVVHSSHGCDIPYLKQHVEGAKILLVNFPGIGMGDEPPSLAALPPGISAHQLGLGVMGAVPRSAVEYRAWSDSASAYIRHQANEFGVPLSDVVCFGASYQGIRAVLAGALADVGWIVAGAPPVHMGTWTERLATTSDEHALPLFQFLFQGAGIAEDPSQLDVLNDLLPGVCRAAGSTSLQIVVSRSDVFYGDAKDLETMMAAEQDAIAVQVIEADYVHHGLVEPALHRQVQQVLDRLQA